VAPQTTAPVDPSEYGEPAGSIPGPTGARPSIVPSPTVHGDPAIPVSGCVYAPGALGTPSWVCTDYVAGCSAGVCSDSGTINIPGVAVPPNVDPPRTLICTGDVIDVECFVGVTPDGLGFILSPIE